MVYKPTESKQQKNFVLLCVWAVFFFFEMVDFREVDVDCK